MWEMSKFQERFRETETSTETLSFSKRGFYQKCYTKKFNYFLRKLLFRLNSKQFTYFVLGSMINEC